MCGSRCRPAPPWAVTRAAWGAHPNGSAGSGERDANSPTLLRESPVLAGDSDALGPGSYADCRACSTPSGRLAFMLPCQVPDRGRLGGRVGPGVADRAARGLPRRQPGLPGSAAGAREVGPCGRPGRRADAVRATGPRALPLRHDALRAPGPSPALSRSATRWRVTPMRTPCQATDARRAAAAATRSSVAVRATRTCRRPAAAVEACPGRRGCRGRRGRRRCPSSPGRGWPRGRARPRSGRSGSRRDSSADRSVVRRAA